ncbi:MAG: hypothetical protein Q9181_000351 [Wetmoreana brouardii]
MSLRSHAANGGVDKTTSSSIPSDGGMRFLILLSQFEVPTLMNCATGQEKQKKLLAADAGHFSMIKALHLADLITELNGTHRFYTSPPLLGCILNIVRAGFCGFMSILSSMRYCLGPPTSYGPIYIALAFIPFGLFFDFMDGKVARWRKKSSLMGQELDSLADLVCQTSTTVPPPASNHVLRNG